MCIKTFKCYVNYSALGCNSIPDIIIVFWNGILFNKHLFFPHEVNHLSEYIFETETHTF